MTHEFTIEEWQNGGGQGGNNILSLEFKEQLNAKPMIQVFKYSDESKVTSTHMPLVNIMYVERSKTLLIISNETFAGYLVIR